jgi:hypothetical protein
MSRHVLALAIALVVAAAPAQAAWPPSGLPVATGAADQTLPIGLTGPNGQLQAFWVDVGSPTHSLDSQHLTIQGTVAPGWPAGGRGVVTIAAGISSPKVTPDGSGGAILAWHDYRSGAHGTYAIRVDSEAAVMPGWNPAGTAICSETGSFDDLVAVCGDGAGGAFVAWTDARNTPPMGTLVYDVFAQHVLPNGSLDPNWPVTGRGLTSGPGFKYPHVLVADGSGGFWLETENSNATSQIAITHHGADGIETSRWTSPSFASSGTGVSDGAGGIFLTWKDCRDCATGSNAIYAIRLAPGGAPAAGWPVGGAAIAISTDTVDFPVIIRTEDGAAMIAWLRTGVAPDAYIARRIEANGSFASAWLAGSRTFAVSSGILSGWPLIAPDGAGGAMFAFRRNTPNLFGSRVDAFAQVPPAFPDTGLSLCSLSGNQFPVSLVSDGLNGAYLLWQDLRDYSNSQFDVYATRFTRDGIVGATTEVPGTPLLPGLALSAPRPNPASGSSSFELTLPAAGHVLVEVLDVAGRQLVVLHDGALDAGPHAFRWDGFDESRRRMPPGVYLVSARTTNAIVGRRIVRLP